MNPAWLDTYIKRYGPLPTNYLIFDTETCGPDRNKDLIIQVGYALATTSSLCVKTLLIDWTAEDSIDQDWFLKSMNDTHAYMTEHKGAKNFPTYRSLATDGYALPLVLEHTYDMFKYAEEHKIPIVGHNFCRFDLPMFERHFKEFLGKELKTRSTTKIIDTGAMVKGSQIGSKPHDDETTSFEYLNRVANAWAPKVQWSLGNYCFEDYKLQAKLAALDAGEVQLHDAGYDCILAHCLLSSIREVL